MIGLFQREPKAGIIHLLTLLLLPSLLLAQSDKSTIAIPTGSAPPSVNGRLDDPIWKDAPFISDFLVKDPVEFGQPSSTTRVAFAYDDHNLYVAAEMRFRSRDELQAMVTRRDRSGPSDRIIISLDTWRDRRTAWSFSVTAAGVRTEYFHGSDSEYDRDFSFDPVWEARTWVGDDRWTTEMRIPFSQLRFNDAEEQLWGLNINRRGRGRISTGSSSPGTAPAGHRRWDCCAASLDSTRHPTPRSSPTSPGMRGLPTTSIRLIPITTRSTFRDAPDSI